MKHKLIRIHPSGSTDIYVPKDKKGTDIFYHSRVTMPDPDGTDIFTVGGFSATVEDVRDESGNLVVIDQDGDFFEIEPYRVEVEQEETKEDKAEQLRRDKKNGLYGDDLS